MRKATFAELESGSKRFIAIGVSSSKSSMGKPLPSLLVAYNHVVMESVDRLWCGQEDMVSEGQRDDDDDHEEAANQSFLNLAGEDGEVDAFELKNILDSVFKRGD